MNKTATTQPDKTANSLSLTRSILQRKCACGNHTIAGGECADCAKKKMGLQRKLTIGASNDPLEQEAERVAGQVVSIPLNSRANHIPPCIQCFNGQAGEGLYTAPPSVDSVLTSSGRPLEPALRQDMGLRFGHDFSRVRVHTGNAAEQSARDVNAYAYTVGNNIVFGVGQYSPGTHEGQRLLAHELAHVVQQDCIPDNPSRSLIVGSSDDPFEREADSAADAALRGEAVSLQRVGVGQVRRLQRAVSKVCNPPSVWFVLGGPQNLPAAQAFGAIAETFISTSVIATNGVALGNFYLDNPLAGPIDPVLVAFIIAKNPGMSIAQKIALAAAAVARPDVLMHQGLLTEFEEVKPNSVAGRAAGRTKVSFLSGFYAGFSLPYTAGATFTPPAPFVIVSGVIPGTSVPLVVTFEITRDRNGLLVYDICVETDWLLASLAAIAIVIAIILILLSRGAIRPVPMPVPPPIPAFAGLSENAPMSDSMKEENVGISTEVATTAVSEGDSIV